MTEQRPEITEDSIEGAMQRNDAIRVIGLALADAGWPVEMKVAAYVLDCIEEGGYTLRLTTHAERKARNDRGMSS